MSRVRTLGDLIEDVLTRADAEGATERHPQAKVIRAINQGGAALQDLLIEVKGKRFFRASSTIPIVKDTSVYALPDDFLSLLNCYIKSYPGEPLAPLQEQDEPFYRDIPAPANRPTVYDLMPGNIEFLPVPRTALEIVIKYVYRWADLEDPGDELEGFDGWEEYVEVFAAIRLLEQDDEPGPIQQLRTDLAEVDRRIRKAARSRDRFRAERVTDVRGAMRPLPAWSRRWFQ